MKGYSAFVLTDESRKRLMKKFPPKFPDVIAHHITHEFNVNDDVEILEPSSIKVLGSRIDDSLNVQVLVVIVDGDSRRPDGGRYHITWSIDRSKGATPKDSNEAIKLSWTLAMPIYIDAIPQFVSHGS